MSVAEMVLSAGWRERMAEDDSDGDISENTCKNTFHI